MPDSSFNVQFMPSAPSFIYGTLSVGPFEIYVVNLTQPAQAALHIRNQVGSEYDTILTYSPISILAVRIP